jgi:hypothetical protein
MQDRPQTKTGVLDSLSPSTPASEGSPSLARPADPPIPKSTPRVGNKNSRDAGVCSFGLAVFSC